MSQPRRQQESIIAELGVRPRFDAATEIEHRVGFLVTQLQQTGARGVVLGLSGGVDSTATGRLCQLAVERVRRSGGGAEFVAMRLPYGIQQDEADAQRAVKFVQPDETITVDVRPASDAMLAAVQGGLDSGDTGSDRSDFVLGNIKARQRMIAQYAVAGARNLLVVGTDHAAEAVMGFYTKFGDGACDLAPLAGLTKRRVRAMAAELGADDDVVRKTPTADLESNNPGLPDEQVFGISYDEIDDFLEGKDVTPAVFDTVVAWHRRTTHKRVLPATPVSG